MIFLLFCIVFSVAAGLTALTRDIALRKNILDIPNARSSHAIPTPRGGGIAIVLTFTFCVLVMAHLGYLHKPFALALAGGGLAIAAIGYADDIYHVRNLARISVHFAAAAWAVLWLHGFPHLNLGAWKFSLHAQGSVLAVLGIVWSINLYNFMDGIDGLAGGEGLFIALAGSIALYLAHDTNTAFLLYLLAAAIAGFTAFNWPPAKIFLGDTGSGFLGYVFAVVALQTANHGTLTLVFWVIVMAIFICDATFTLCYRALRGQKWYAAHREHAYQHLIAWGASHKQVTSGLMLVNFFIILPLALGAIYWPWQSFWFLSALIISLFISWLVVKSLRLTGTQT
jgi:Fuc2NAc and GlcNAc transferase